MDSIFKGMKVVELASVLAGPAVGMFFAELGATVIKVENKRTGGDLTRKWKLPSEDKQRDYSAYYCSVNYKKKSVFLDFREEDDYQSLIDLVRDADIVISNYRKHQAEKMKVDYNSLKHFNKRLVFAQLTGFGEGNPRPAFDMVLQAEAGFLHMTGEPGRPPVKMPVALIDILAAHQMKEGILIALLKRATTGRGGFVETSLYEAALASLANQASNWLMAGHIPQAMGTLHPNIAPYGEVFYSIDNKPIVLAVGTEKQFVNLCKALQSSLFEEEEFETNTQRVIHRDALGVHLSKSIAQLSISDLEELFSKWQVPYARIRNMKEVFEPAQAQAMILEEKMPDGNVSRRVKTIAFKVK